MVAKLFRKLRLSAAARGTRASRHWTANAFGRSVLDAEAELLQRLVHAPNNRRIIELATIETPECGLPVIASFTAAQQSWRQPVVASLTQLPVINRAVDIVIWRYLALDSNSRYWLLQDVGRVLAPNGILYCCHLNPFFSACWRYTALINLGYQSATAITAAANMAGLQWESSFYGGPGWWKYRALLISRFRKPMANRVKSQQRAGDLARRPAAAMLRPLGSKEVSKY